MPVVFGRATPVGMSSKRQRLPLDERRDQLLDIGLDLFTQQSYDAVSIDHIAEAAGVSKGLLYHYFGSKRGLYVACVRAAADGMIAATRPALSLPAPLKAWTALHAFLDFVERRSSVFLGLLQGGVGVDAEVAAILADTRQRLAMQVLEGSGVDPSRPAFRFAARTYIGAVETASLAWLEAGGGDRRMLLRIVLPTLPALLEAAADLDPDAGYVAPVSAADFDAAMRLLLDGV